MKTLYLHIGTPKTGTSAIQYFCARNRDALEQKGIYYPDFGIQLKGYNADRNGAFYVVNIFDDKNKHIEEEEARVRAEGLEKLQQAFEDHDTILLSDEGYWNHAKMQESKDWAELRDFCDKIGVQLKIIVYLRRQDEVIQSYWAQKVKERNMKISLSEYMNVQYMADKARYTKFQLDYQEQLQMIASGVGKENIIVRVYEKGQYQGKNATLLSDLFSIFDLDVSEGFIEEHAQRNSSLHGIYLETKRLLNNSNLFRDSLYHSGDRFLIKRLRELQATDENSANLSKMKQFSYEEVQEFLKLYEEGNQSIAKEYLNREDGILFYNELNPAEYKTFELTDPEELQEIINVCAKIMLTQEKDLQETKAKLKAEKKKLEQKSLKKRLKKRIKKLTHLQKALFLL